MDSEHREDSKVSGRPEEILKVERVSPLYKTSYQDIEVVELLINDIPITRRCKDSYFNISQILELLEIDEPQKEKVLEEEILSGEYETIGNNSSSKYQGTWIPHDKAVKFCRTHHLFDLLKPLLTYNPSINEIPSKEEWLHVVQNPNGGLKRGSIDNDDEYSGASSKKIKSEEGKLPELETFDYDTKSPNPMSPFTVKPIPENQIDEKSKVIMSSLFLPNQKDITLLQLVGGDDSQLQHLQIDVPIDDNGQTALHLAATLGRVELVKDLVRRGANRLRGDNDGQTTLVRAIHATNCFDDSCFEQILDYLYPSITVLDNKGRTILHHIAYTCGRKGRNDASKYYLETLLEWVVRRGPILPGSQALSLTKFMTDVVNISDRNGDTCLNIAAMVGNKHIINQLLEVGADPNKANKAGIKPIDCGIFIKSPNKVYAEPSIPPVSFNDKKGSSEIIESIQEFVGQLGKDFKEEMLNKTTMINELHPLLREKTLKLSEERKKFDQLQKTVHKISEYKTKITNLNKVINEEEERFKEQTKQLPNFEEFDGEFDADEPFTVWPVYHEVEAKIEEMLANGENLDESSLLDKITPEMILEKLEGSDVPVNDLPPSIVLEARVNAYKENNELLIERAKNKKSSSMELESQFKRVIALCIGAKAEDIDESLIESLLHSVENDPDPEISQIKKVLKIVDNLDSK